MVRIETENEQRQRLEFERLVEAIENGEVDSIEDLNTAEIALLTNRTRPGESLEDLFDRLRQASRDDRD